MIIANGGGRYEGTLVAIIDDSLALLTNSRGYEDCHEVFMGSDICDKGGTNDGLYLVNYRKKRTPYWGDTIEGRMSFVEGFYNDSSAFFQMQMTNSVFGGLAENLELFENGIAKLHVNVIMKNMDARGLVGMCC